MEYILKHDLFNILAIIAEKEKLIGIKVLIFKFISNIIGQLKNQIIAHQSVFSSIQVRFNIIVILFVFTNKHFCNYFRS